MKTPSRRSSISKRPNYIPIVGVFIFAITALAVPFNWGGWRTQAVKTKASAKASEGRIAGKGSRYSTKLSMPTLTGETIALYAADCVTPKDSFKLGEVVCAKTDGVTLSGNYYMNWIDSQLNQTNGGTITSNPQTFLFAPPTAGTWKATIGRTAADGNGPPDSSIIGNPPLFTVTAGQPAIGIYNYNCTTPKSVFNVQATGNDLTVCAKVTGGNANQYVLWSNADFETVQSSPNTGQSTFNLTPGSSVGDWRVLLYEPFGGSVYATASFTVIDASNPSADLAISVSGFDNVAAGDPVVYDVQVTNLGPDTVAPATVSSSVPTNTTFESFALFSGPSGVNCAVPPDDAPAGSSIVCTIPSMARGESARFVATYNVVSGAPNGTIISSTATVSSSTTDPNSANDSSTSQVTVVGTAGETCTLDCPADVVVTADTVVGGQPGAYVSYSAAAVAGGSCGSISNNPPSGSFFEVGTHSIISSSELGAASCTFTVTVLDSNPPTITCPSNITQQLNQGETQRVVDPGYPTVTASGSGTITFVRSDDTQATYDDNGNVVTPAVVHDLDDPFQTGTTGITWTVTDAGGRTASCTQTITLIAAEDRDAVTISCPANVSATAPQGSCEATLTAQQIGTPTTNYPNDPNVEIESQRSDGRSLSEPFPGGTTIITWKATDDTNGTTASCNQSVTVTVPDDTTPPTLHVPPNINETTSSCTAQIEELGEATAEDSGPCNNGQVSISRSGVPPGNIFPTGTTLITYTATDGAGNTATGVQQVRVTESPAIPPTVDAPANVSVNTGPTSTSCGAVVSDAVLGTATASDNCPGVTVTRTGVPAGNFFPVGNTNVTYTATDRSGNTANDIQVVTVVDNTAPVISCPANITQNTDPGLCSALVNHGTATAIDNCDSNPTIQGTRSDNQPLDAPYPKGTTTITWTATDHATPTNNQSSCQQTITVEDHESPVITTNGLTPILWPASHEYHTFTVANFVTAVSDNCDALGVSNVVIQKVTSDENENGGGSGNTLNDIVIAADCKSVQVRAERRNSADGRVYTITFKVTDSSGNVGTKTSTIHVPKNLGVPVVDSGPHYTVNGTCP